MALVLLTLRFSCSVRKRFQKGALRSFQRRQRQARRDIAVGVGVLFVTAHPDDEAMTRADDPQPGASTRSQPAVPVFWRRRWPGRGAEGGTRQGWRGARIRDGRHPGSGTRGTPDGMRTEWSPGLVAEIVERECAREIDVIITFDAHGVSGIGTTSRCTTACGRC